MNEHCVDCPWFDRERETCCRKPPRFCDADTSYPEPAPSNAAGLETVETGPAVA